MFRAQTTIKRWFMPRPAHYLRSYSTQDSKMYYLPRLRILSPVIWSVCACSTIYVSFASYDVWRNAQRLKAHGKVLKSFEQLEDLNRKDYYSRVVRKPTSERPEFSEPAHVSNPRGRFTLGLIAATVSVHALSSLRPQSKLLFAHVPAWTRNFTLFTATFGHSGLLHLGVNMYGLFYLMPAAFLSPALKESGAHATAFYLSAGILSGLAQHIAAISLRRGILTPSLGASGALLALFGIVGVSFSDMKVGIIFVPGFTLKINEALIWLALFDALGIFVQYPGINFAHAAHLGGLGLGVAYARYGGERRLWRPARKVAFKTMHSLGLL
ncbi:hypothetical protein NPX13_g6270 [Xylaria arbuscula]|uniref:Peptidase S54 rhomboid domain-containing protein n=1 Tax=Xylaria arbuscula TaxID=114810 RepID=A0A9W8ND70_9PEZI|nr:hypothetical protein NPX13_g6270 [Xylaria arbuscula]